MRSTGEVMGWDRTFPRAFLKAQMGAGTALPTTGTLFVSVKESDKTDLLVEASRILHELGFRILATDGTQRFLASHAIPATRVNKVYEGRPHIVDTLKDGGVQIVFNTTEGAQSIADSRAIRSLTLSGRDDVTVLGRHGHHRRRLALLAVLAATGDRGWSRDQLLLFFWPEASQARARHSLDQLLYALRSSLGDELFDGTDPVRLTREVVTSDVDAFTDALDRGQLEEAVNLYRGPFLGGFHLDAAPEFDPETSSSRGEPMSTRSPLMATAAPNRSPADGSDAVSFASASISATMCSR